MDKRKYILFDCMETIVDLRELPNIRDYAYWGYKNSGVEDLWESFDSYFQYYLLARDDISSRLHQYQEYEMYERFYHIVKFSFPDMPDKRKEGVAQRLYKNYWVNYKSTCYIKDDTAMVIPKLSETFKLGVVSNFMVKDGIEELLEINGISKYFNIVITSVAEGWRKPNPIIYMKAMEKLGAKPDETIFIGDDYVNDYVTPLELGMKPIFLDRYDKHPEIMNRVSDYNQLAKLLLG